MSNSLFSNPNLAVLVSAMFPVLEHGAVPLGLLQYQLGLVPTIATVLLGNFLSMSILLVMLQPVTRWMRSLHPKLARLIDWWFDHTHRKHSRVLARWGSLALIAIVTIPIPFLGGTWTGALAAHLLGLGYRRAIIFLMIGALGAALIMTLTSLGGTAALRAIL